MTTKAWEETWEAREDGVWDPEQRVTIAFGPMADDAAKLAAQAPAMARLLMALEVVTIQLDGDFFEGCPCCQNVTMLDLEPGKPGIPYTKHPGKHARDCGLASVLRAAGVRA